jgi:hypothetical protein
MSESDAPIEQSKQSPPATRRKKLRFSSGSSSRVDIDLLIARYGILLSAKEHALLVYRALFGALTFAVLFVNISSSYRILGTGCLSIVLAVTWILDGRKRTIILDYAEQELLTIFREEERADDYIRSRYYSSARLGRRLSIVEPFMWSTAMLVAALLNAGPAVLKSM